MSQLIEKNSSNSPEPDNSSYSPSQHNSSYLSVENLHMDWDTISIDFSCTLEKGKMLAIVGHSGSGKSTVLRMIAGLLPANSTKIASSTKATKMEDSANTTERASQSNTTALPSIILDSQDITATDSAKRGIGMVFQSPWLFNHLKVIDNASYGLLCQGWKKKDARQVASSFLSKFGLEGFENRWPESLSGGEAQRVSLIRTLITEPKLVLFDEPFSALDAPLRKKLGADLRKWQQELEFAGIMVTHDITEAKMLADTVMVMKKGKVIWTGNPNDFSEDLL